MKKKYIFLQGLVSFMLGISLLIISSFNTAEASHFRYGNISWQNTSGNSVTFKVSQAWRGNFFGAFPSVGQNINIGASGILNFGDGTTNQIILTVTSVNPVENWFYGEFTTTHLYTTSGTRVVNTTNCCRISNLVNNPDGEYEIRTTVNVGSGNRSPVSSIVPIVDVPVNNAVATFAIGAVDPDGSPLSFRFSTSAEASNGIGFSQPLGLSINASTGQMTFNTVGKSVGQLYSTQIMIGDGSVVTALDFIIRISNSVGTPPFFVLPPTPTNGQVFNVNAGSNVSFTVRAADNDAGSSVSLSVAGAPVGSTFTPSLPTSGNPVSTIFSWNTTVANAGSYSLNFNAIDNTGATANTNVTINVLTDVYYSKASGDLHNTLTWGVNPDGSGANPPDFGLGKTFNLANRSTTYTMTADWTVGGNLINPAGAQLQINGFTLSIARTTGPGTISGSSASNLEVMGTFGGDQILNFTSGSNILNSLLLDRAGPSPSATLGNALNIVGILNVLNGTLNTSNNLTLKSSAANTARVAPVSGTISGNVTVERYIPARRAWRIMSAPVGGTQSINAAWQEGVTTSSGNSDPNPGFGTHVTQGSAVNGYDFNPVIAMYSILKYSSASDNWTTIANTNATNVNAEAYMLFVRGNRGVTLGYNNVPPNNTILRSNGPLKTGDQVFAVSATGFNAIPNPYASPINFATLTRNNVQNNFYLWDPKLGGPNGVGGYVLLSDNGGGGYTITPTPVSPESQLIQSGQGFLVHSTGSAGSITIKESDKSATAATNVFRSSSSNRGLRTTLQIMDKGNVISVIDETFTAFGTSYSNDLDAFDPLKLANMQENLATVRNGQTLMVERRQPVSGTDTIFLKLWNTEQKQYILQFTPENLNATNVQTAVLFDSYLKTTTPINLSEATSVTFSVDANPASANEQRFMVVLGADKSLITEDITFGKGTFKLSPNPMTGRTINLQFINQPKGTYNVALVNNLGQVIFKNQVKHAGGTAAIPLHLANTITANVFQLQIQNSKANINTAIKLVGK